MSREAQFFGDSFRHPCGDFLAVGASAQKSSGVAVNSGHCRDALCLLGHCHRQTEPQRRGSWAGPPVVCGDGSVGRATDGADPSPDRAAVVELASWVLRGRISARLRPDRASQPILNATLLNHPGFVQIEPSRDYRRVVCSVTTRPYRVSSGLHRAPPLLLRAGWIRWGRAGGGCYPDRPI
jgi:hypothetical protein